MVVILFIDDCPEYYQVEIDLSDFFLLLFFLIFSSIPCLSFGVWRSSKNLVGR